MHRGRQPKQPPLPPKMTLLLILSGIVPVACVHRRDLAKYEQLMVDSSADMKDEAGWKLLTGDVFRSPNRAKGLAVHVSSIGEQPCAGCGAVCQCVGEGTGAGGTDLGSLSALAASQLHAGCTERQ